MLMFHCSTIGLHLEIAQPTIPPRNPGKPGSSGNMPKLTLIMLPSINSIPPNMETQWSFQCEKSTFAALLPATHEWFHQEERRVLAP